ncbi:MAG: hypothetical protein U5K79_13610 [Cyclobacteriaceae bacterium]|nr:hypothetical protein [Cyclobacteriaceae bacterium]
MKSLLDKWTRDELAGRINSLNENSVALWGKMNVYQMLKHCGKADEMYQSKEAHKQIFLGRLFGQMVLKNMLRKDAPLKKKQSYSSDAKN